MSDDTNDTLVSTADEAQALLDEFDAAEAMACDHSATSTRLGCLCGACSTQYRVRHNAGLVAPRLARAVIAQDAEIAALRSIIEGRTTSPTREEVEELAAVGGAFRHKSSGGGEGWVHSRFDLPFAVRATDGADTRWWAHDAERRPCAWPVGGGPR